jgi:hypothetical protein
MSNIAQTIAIIASMVVIFGAQTAWILRSFAQLDQRLDRMDSRFDRMDTRLDELKTEIVRDHGERIAKLEERVGIGGAR